MTRRAVAQDQPTKAPILQFGDGAIEGIKWLGLVLMTIDHINKYLLAAAAPWMFACGRAALPLFCVALAYNLARPEAIREGAFQRTALRLAGFGALASAPFMALGGLGWGWWPLNIMFTLCLGTTCAWLLSTDKRGATVATVALVLVGGAFVEFWWPALACFLFAWSYFRQPSLLKLAGWTLALLSLYLVNRNHWALAAVPILIAASRWSPAIPRVRGLFYWYYPAHLTVICAALWAAQSGR